MKKIRVYLGIGSNLDHPVRQVQQAIALLQQLPETQFVQASSLYHSKPMGPKDQPDYVNAVVVLDTQLSPEILLDYLQTIENQQNRVRGKERFGPRIIDLDILLYGNQMIESERLTIPHYGIRDRSFVLYPLAEIAPDLMLPAGEAIQDLLKRFVNDEYEVQVIK